MKPQSIVLLGDSVPALTACNTVAGTGRDAQAAGRAGKRAAATARLL